MDEVFLVFFFVDVSIKETLIGFFLNLFNYFFEVKLTC